MTIKKEGVFTAVSGKVGKPFSLWSLLCSLRGMLVLLLLVLCVCFHVACVMYLHLTSVQVGLLHLLPQAAAQRLDSVYGVVQ